MKSIKKHELQKFLEKEVAPKFDSNWIVGPHCTLQRNNGCIAQGFSLFGLSISSVFRVDLFNRLLIPEIDFFTRAVLRERKTRLTTSSWISRFFMPREIWFVWNKRFDDLDRMVDLIQVQLEPPYDQEITLRSMLAVIDSKSQKNENFQKKWARAVILGLLGDLQIARQTMDQLIETFGLTADKYNTMGKESYQARVEAELQRQRYAQKMLKAMKDEKKFHNYCESIRYCDTLTGSDSN